MNDQRNPLARPRLIVVATAAWLAVLSCVPSTSVRANDRVTSDGILTLVNGDTFSGQLRSGELIRWQNNEFLDPFEFPVNAVASVRFPQRSNNKPQDSFVVQCVDGDILTGEIVEFDADRIVLSSSTLGKLSIRTESIRQIDRARLGESTRVTFVTGLSDWNTSGWSTEGWAEDGDELVSTKPGASLHGDFAIPDRAMIDFELSWEAKPDFVFAIGVMASSDFDAHTDGLRLETADNQLVAIRETESSADVDVIRDLSDTNSIRLIAYLDQLSGETKLFLPTGEQIAELQNYKYQKVAIGGGIRIINRGQSLKLCQLRVTPWTGPLRDTARLYAFDILDTRGTAVAGDFHSFDSKSKTLTIAQSERHFSINLASLTSVRFGAVRKLGSRPESVFRLRGGSQISANLASVTDQHWFVGGEKFIGEVQIPCDQVQLVTVASATKAADRSKVELGAEIEGGRVGRIELTTTQHLGLITNLDDSSPAHQTDGLSAIRWRPLASTTGCRLKPDVAGRIVYDDANVSAKSRRHDHVAPNTQTLRPVDDRNFGELFLESVDRVESRRARRDQHVVHLTSGDVIACRVESIGESGVYVSTADKDNTLIEHGEVKAIELVGNADLPDVDDTKKNRLLTLPRLQKSTPPTHIICSADGDLLRCRLIRVNHDSIEVEVQNEMLSIPRPRVSQIIWLHPQTKRTADPISDRYQGLVQALWFDQRRLTFAPTATTETTIRGTSRIVGDCNVQLSKVVQITLGARIAAESTKLMYSDWNLTESELPLIMQIGEQGNNASETSELVSRPAPKILLRRLDGGSFDLDDYRGRIVVLDFWASWHETCMQSLPHLHKAIAAYDPTKVILIGINLEERREIVTEALDRLGIQMVVALDVDGRTTSSFQASAMPHMVVVAPNGKVANVVVGGRESDVVKVTQAVEQLLDSKP